MALPPFDPTNPIPNNPFYFPQTASITGPDGPLIVGSGLAISPEGVISATGTTTTGVSSLYAGPGIFVTGNTGDIVIDNTGVLEIQAGLGITVTANTGNITISADNLGTVTSVGVGYGLGIFGSVGPITTSGIIELVDTGVVPGVYTAPQIQIDEKGRIISATSDSYVASVTANSPLNATAGSNPVISVNAATTAQPGVVQLSDSVTSGSSTTAATSAAVQTAYIRAGEGVSKTLLTGKGALISASAVNAPATVAVGADGQFLVADSTQPAGLNWVNIGGGTVSQVNTGVGLTGGPITTSGTIDLANTAVTPGNYTYASFSVDAQGRLYAASSGVDPVTSVTGTAPIQVTAGQTPVVSVDAASTLAAGVVQLYNATDSTSTALALTAAAGKSLQDQIDELDNLSNLVFAGTLDCSTGLMATVTQQASNVGFAVGSPLPAAATTNAEFFVIVTVPGVYTPPGGTQVSAHQGDWFRSTGTAWEFYDVGIEVLNATTTNAGIVRLSTDAETQAGTDATIAVTPASLQSKLSDSTSTTSSTTIASSTAVKTAWDLADAALPKATYTALGDLVSGTGAGTYVTLGVGNDGQILVADSGAAGGLSWTDNLGVTEVTAGTGLITSSGSPITSTGTINLADTSVTPGVYNYAGIIVDQQGRITAATNGAQPLPLTGGTMTGSITFQNLGDGINFQGTAPLLGITDLVNVVDSEIAASATAVKTAYDLAASAASGGVPSTSFTAVGDILAGTGSGTYAALNSSLVQGQVLSVDSASPTGLAWTNAATGTVTSVTTGSGLTYSNPTTTPVLDIVQTLVPGSTGSFTNVSLTVNGYGQITAINSGADPLPLTGGTMTGTITFQNAGDGINFQNNSEIVDISDAVNSTAIDVAASSLAVKTAYDLAFTAASGSIPASSFTAQGEILAATGNGVYAPLPGTGSGVADGKVLSTDSLASTGLAWIDPPVTGVASLTSGSLALVISNSNPGPDDLVITVKNAGIGIAGVVELNNSEFSTSIATAPTSRVANLAYQTAQDAVVNATQGGLSSNYMGYVSGSNGNDTTGQFGTTLAYATIQAAIDNQGIAPQTIFIAAGTYTEDLTIQVGGGTHLVGLNAEGQIDDGVEIIGTLTLQYTGAGSGGDTTFTGIRFRQPQIINPTATIQVTGTGQTAGEITFDNCRIERTYGTDLTQQWAFEGSGTWSVPVNFNNCYFSGSIKMGAGAADGSGAELILRNCGGFSVGDYISLETGTVKVLDTPQYLCPIKQTGGFVEVSNVGSGILSSASTLNTVFGGLGYSYQGSAASVGTGLIEFTGSVPAQGIVDIGTNVQYGLDGLTISLANLNLISTEPIYDPGVSDLTILQSAYLQSQQLTVVDPVLTGTPADQYAIVAKDDGTINRITNFDAGNY